ncbi:MAG: hypothetical protein ABIQ52_15675 [Vicinamibacterales bacterium]
MEPSRAGSEFRFEKRRSNAILSLVTGEVVKGCFFTAAGSTHRDGAERIADLLNSEAGFFPFEVGTESTGRTVLYNRLHVLTVQVLDDEARQDAGYDVAPRRVVSLLLSNNERMEGAVRVYRPEGRSRVSDWTRQPEVFRYVEATDVTFIVNAAHIVSVTEVPAS